MHNGVRLPNNPFSSQHSFHCLNNFVGFIYSELFRIPCLQNLTIIQIQFTFVLIIKVTYCVLNDSPELVTDLLALPIRTKRKATKKWRGAEAPLITQVLMSQNA